jgi:uncharacterized protein (TIGR02270 family)
MKRRRKLVIPDILEEHHAELQFLWGLRRAAVRSPAYSLRALGELDERIAAHADGLVIGGRHARPLLRAGLEAAPPEAAFAAAYPLLASGEDEAARLVLDAFRQAKGDGRIGLTEALCHGPITLVRQNLREALASPADALAAAAAEVLACHGLLELTTAQFDRFLKHPDPAIRQAGWRVAARTRIPRYPETYAAGLQDADPAVRHEALSAAAWGRHGPLLDHCRRLASEPVPKHADALLLLAILGRPDELSRILGVGRATSLGPVRCRILGAYGHPAVVETLLKEMTATDPRTAVAAGAAFTRITGGEIASGQRVALPPEDGSEPDGFTMEFLDEAPLPSPDAAHAHWQKVKDSFARGTRWCRGFDLSQGAPDEVLAKLDLESRWEACLRGQFDGTRRGSPSELEAFPQKRR